MKNYEYLIFTIRIMTNQVLHGLDKEIHKLPKTFVDISQKKLRVQISNKCALNLQSSNK